MKLIVNCPAVTVAALLMLVSSVLAHGDDTFNSRHSGQGRGNMTGLLIGIIIAAVVVIVIVVVVVCYCCRKRNNVEGKQKTTPSNPNYVELEAAKKTTDGTNAETNKEDNESTKHKVNFAEQEPQVIEASSNRNLNAED